MFQSTREILRGCFQLKQSCFVTTGNFRCRTVLKLNCGPSSTWISRSCICGQTATTNCLRCSNSLIQRDWTDGTKHARLSVSVLFVVFEPRPQHSLIGPGWVQSSSVCLSVFWEVLNLTSGFGCHCVHNRLLIILLKSSFSRPPPPLLW